MQGASELEGRRERGQRANALQGFAWESGWMGDARKVSMVEEGNMFDIGARRGQRATRYGVSRWERGRRGGEKGGMVDRIDRS